MEDKKNHDEQRRASMKTSLCALTGALAAGSGLILPGRALAQTAEFKPTMTQPTVIGYSNKRIGMERVTYPNKNLGTTIVGNLFKPAGFDAGKKYPAIVVTHPFGGVKEQTSGLYAIKLAEQGFITLAYDASYQGESGGEPRLMEVPSNRVEDISSAIDFLSNHPQVDAERIGSLGICAGGGYVLNSAQTELRIKAVAAVSMFDLGAARREGMGTISFEERMKRLKDVGEQRNREARGEAARLVPVVPDSDAQFTANTNDLYREGYEYYRTKRAQHPNSPNRYMFSSLAQQMAFFPFAQIETISPRPLLLIAGSKAVTLFWSEEALQKAKDPKELFIVQGATHIDMYDKPQFVTPAVKKLKEFFVQSLGA